MRVVSLNLDLVDATALRDAIAQHLAEQLPSGNLIGLDERLHSLQLTLDELTRMIERPAPRRCWPPVFGEQQPDLRLVDEASPGIEV